MSARVFVNGNLGKDAEVKELGGKKAIQFSVASNDKKKGEKVTQWYNVVLFRENTALAEYLKKGTSVNVFGKLEVRTYQTNTGSQGVSCDIIASDIDLLSSSSESPSQPTQQPLANAQAPEANDLPF